MRLWPARDLCLQYDPYYIPYVFLCGVLKVIHVCREHCIHFYLHIFTIDKIYWPYSIILKETTMTTTKNITNTNYVQDDRFLKTILWITLYCWKLPDFYFLFKIHSLKTLLVSKIDSFIHPRYSWNLILYKLICYQRWNPNHR